VIVAVLHRGNRVDDVVKCSVVAHSGNHCWNGNTTILSVELLFRVDAVVRNIKVFSVAIGMQH
jgi:hypothetical protein